MDSGLTTTDTPSAEIPKAKSKPTRMIELDFVRGIAILMVLIHHFNNGWADQLNISSYAWAGVDMFFVLSGFLVGGLLIKEWRKTDKIDGFRFLKRRAFKIWPAYYFYIFFEMAAPTHPWNTFVLGNLLNIQNYTGTTLGITWSLAVEEHFYLLLTLGLVLASRNSLSPARVLVFFIVIALSVTILRVFLFSYGYPCLYYTHTRIDALLFGVILATLYNYWPATFAAIQKQRLLLWIWVLLCFLFVINDDRIGRQYLGLVFADLGCVGFLLLMFRPVTCPNRGWLYRLVAHIGIYSYGIYLWHTTIGIRGAEILAAHLPWLSHWFLSIVPYPAAIIFGILMTKLIEFPCLKLREILVPSPIGSHLLPDPSKPREPDKSW